MSHPYNPLAALRPKALRRQARSDVQSQIGPLAKQINDRTGYGTRNIQGVSSQLAQSLMGYAPQAEAIYSGAQDRLGAIDRELADRLGSGQADALRKQLADAGQDTSAADSLAASVHGAAGAHFASGSSERAQLNTLGALASDYGAKLPGIARLAGLQDVSQREAQGQQQLSDLHSKTPGLIAQALADARNREFQKAALGQSGLIDQAKLAETASYHQGTLSLRQKAIQAANQRSGMNLAERAREHNVSSAEQAKRDEERARANKTREKQARRRQWYKEHHPGSGSGPPSLR